MTAGLYCAHIHKIGTFNWPSCHGIKKPCRNVYAIKSSLHPFSSSSFSALPSTILIYTHVFLVVRHHRSLYGTIFFARSIFLPLFFFLFRRSIIFQCAHKENRSFKLLTLFVFFQASNNFSTARLSIHMIN
jgi:hypothetical protein